MSDLQDWKIPTLGKPRLVDEIGRELLNSALSHLQSAAKSNISEKKSISETVDSLRATSKESPTVVITGSKPSIPASPDLGYLNIMINQNPSTNEYTVTVIKNRDAAPADSDDMEEEEEIDPDEDWDVLFDESEYADESY